MAELGFTADNVFAQNVSQREAIIELLAAAVTKLDRAGQR